MLLSPFVLLTVLSSISYAYEVCNTPACQKLSKFLKSLIDTSANPCDSFYQYSCGNWLKTTSIPPGEFEISVDMFSAAVIDNTTKEALEAIDTNRKEKYPKAMIYAKRFYSHCHAYDKSEDSAQLEVMEYLRSFADWPFFNPKWNPEAFDVAAVLGKLEAELNMDTLVLLSIEPDKCNSSNTALYIKPSELTTDSIYYNQSLFPDDFLKKRFIKVVLTTMEQIALNLGIRHKVKDIKEMAQEVVAFELEIGAQLDTGITPGILVEVDKEIGADEPHLNISLRQLNKQFPLGSSWETFLQTTFRNKSSQLDHYTNNLYLTNREFLKFLSKKLCETPKRTIANYLMWRLIYSGLKDDWIDSQYLDIPSIPFSQSELSDVEANLVGIHGGFRRLRNPIIIADKPKKNREKTCLDDTKLYFDYVIGRLYVEKRFSQSKLAAAEKLTNDIQKAFNETLSETKWFTAVARSRVLEKLNRLQKNVGYPDWILNDTRLNDYYREFKIRSNSSYFRNVLKFRRADVGPLNDLARKNTFVLPVATVRNAAYSPESNSITIPAGQLEFPYFDPDFPDWFNYATVGYTIGHELTHGYDTNGEKYDSRGNVCSPQESKNYWLLEGSNGTFADLTQCLIDDFSRYCYQFVYVNRSAPLLDVILSLERNPTQEFDEPANSSLFCINGEKTIDENIADLNGFRMAYKAFKKLNSKDVRLPGFEDYTPDQLFFLAFGAGWCDNVSPLGLKVQLITDVHSPADARVNVLLSHIPEFSKAFKCERKDPMYARRSCDLY